MKNTGMNIGELRHALFAAQDQDTDAVIVIVPGRPPRRYVVRDVSNGGAYGDASIPANEVRLVLEEA